MFKLSNLFNSIKTRVRLFFLVNIGLVVFNYFYTVYYNNRSESDTRLLEVSKENESFIGRLEYITKAIVEGGEEELKKILSREIDNYEDNLTALQNGGEAIINGGREKINIAAIEGNGKEELAELESSWRELERLLQIIIEEEIEISKEVDTSLLQVGNQLPPPDFITPPDLEESPPSVLDSLPPTDSTQYLAESVDSTELFIAPQGLVDPTSNARFILTVRNPKIDRAYFLAQTSLEETSSQNRLLSQVLEDNLNTSQIYLRRVLLFTFLANLLLLIGGTFYIGSFLIIPLKRISSTAKEVASGDINTQVSYQRKDEIGEVADSLNLIVGSFKQYTEFAENIGRGNFQSNFDVKSEKDTLGYTLLSMRDNLKNVAEEDRKRNWANEGFALFSNILRSTEQDMEDLAYDVISNLVKYIDANQGGLFLLMEGEEGSYLELQATFAYNKRKYEERHVKVGQGLLGQVVLERETIYLDKVPDHYIQITSGLGKATPRSLLIVPLKVNDEVFGAMEIASFHQFQAYEVDFINKLSENIASTIASVKINENTKMLLEETRQYAEQMQAQEEEMRQNMEELATTQEEMERNQRKLENYKENLEQEVEKRTGQLREKELALSNALSQLQGIIDSSKSGIVALDTDFKVVSANKRIREIIKVLRNSEFEIGDYWFKIFRNENDKIHARRLWERAFSGQYYSLEDRYTAEDGSPKWLDISFNPIPNEENEIIGASMFVRDVTERKRDLKNIEITAQILDNSANEVYVFDANTLHFLRVNEKARKNLGYTFKELRDLTPYDIAPSFDAQSFRTYIAPLKEGSIENLNLETVYHRKDGSTYDVELSLQFFKDEDTPLFAAIAQDITQRKKHEQELEEALERFDLATAATNEGVWEMHVVPQDPINPDHHAWWSRRFKALLGFEEHEFEEKLESWISRLHPEDKNKTMRDFYNHLIDQTGETPFALEYRLLTKDNQYLWFSASGETVRNESGLPRKFAGSIRNIDRRKRAEQELEEQTAVVNGILNASINSIISVNEQERIISANGITEDLFGYSADELVGNSITTLLHSPEELNFDDIIDQVKEMEATKKDGTVFPVDISISETHIDDRKIYVFIFRDATQRKQREQMLARSEERLRKISDATLEGIFFHEEGLITDINKAFTRITGFESEDVIGKPAFNHLTPESQQVARAKAAANDESPYEVEFIRKDGQVIPLEVRARSIFLKGTLSRVVSVRDISARRLSELQQKQLVDVLDTLPDGISYMDAQGIIRYANRSILKILGYEDQEEIVNQSISRLHTPEMMNKLIQEWLPSSIQQGSFQNETVVLAKNGETVRVQQTIISHLNKNGELAYVSYILSPQESSYRSNGENSLG